jgi:hypothetical protein
VHYRTWWSTSYVIISCDLTSGLGTTDLPIDDPSMLHKLQLIVIENRGEVMHFRHLDSAGHSWKKFFDACKIKQIRVWDGMGQHLKPNIDPRSLVIQYWRAPDPSINKSRFEDSCMMSPGKMAVVDTLVGHGVIPIPGKNKHSWWYRSAMSYQCVTGIAPSNIIKCVAVAPWKIPTWALKKCKFKVGTLAGVSACAQKRLTSWSSMMPGEKFRGLRLSNLFHDFPWVFSMELPAFSHWGLGTGGPRHNIDLEISHGFPHAHDASFEISIWMIFNWRVLHHYFCRIFPFLICLLVCGVADMMGSKHGQLNSIATYCYFTCKTLGGLIFPISPYFTDKLHQGVWGKLGTPIIGWLPSGKLT